MLYLSSLKKNLSNVHISKLQCESHQTTPSILSLLMADPKTKTKNEVSDTIDNWLPSLCFSCPSALLGANPISSQISQSFRNAHLDRKADTSLCKHHNLSIVLFFLFPTFFRYSFHIRIVRFGFTCVSMGQPWPLWMQPYASDLVLQYWEFVYHIFSADIVTNHNSLRPITFVKQCHLLLLLISLSCWRKHTVISS